MMYLLLSTVGKKDMFATTSADHAFSVFLTNTDYDVIACQIEDMPNGIQIQRIEDSDGVYSLHTGDITMGIIGSIDIIVAKAKYGYNNTSIECDHKYLMNLYFSLGSNKSQGYYLECREKLFKHVEERINDIEAVEDFLSTI